MSQVRCIRAAAGLLLAAAVAVPGPAGLAAPGRGPASRPPVAAEPAPLWRVLTVAVSPVLVPPMAPVDVAVAAPLLAGRRVAVEVAVRGGPWAVAARPVLDEKGAATVRVARTPAATYDVRAVFTPDRDRPIAAGASERRSFEVTAKGLGDPEAYRYVHVSRGAPARWDPCSVVTYRVNTEDARPNSLADLREALRRVTYETGVVFREAGTTRQVPGAPRFRYDADLVVAWTNGGDGTTLLGGDRAAAGGFEHPVAGRGGRPRINQGFVVVDTTALVRMGPGFGEGETEGQVLLHELGHVMGLDHIEEDHQIMRSTVQKMDAALYGAGDLTGLRRIGRAAGCL